jgi:hypothetical protein
MEQVFGHARVNEHLQVLPGLGQYILRSSILWLLQLLLLLEHLRRKRLVVVLVVLVLLLIGER